MIGFLIHCLYLACILAIGQLLVYLFTLIQQQKRPKPRFNQPKRHQVRKRVPPRDSKGSTDWDTAVWKAKLEKQINYPSRQPSPPPVIKRSLPLEPVKPPDLQPVIESVEPELIEQPEVPFVQEVELPQPVEVLESRPILESVESEVIKQPQVHQEPEPPCQPLQPPQPVVHPETVGYSQRELSQPVKFSKSAARSSVSWKVKNRLNTLINGDMKTADRLLESTRLRNPERSEQWVWEKVIFDLERDRRA